MRHTIITGFSAALLVALAVAGLSIRGQEPEYSQPPSYPQQNPQFEGQSQQDLAADQQHGVARLSIVQGDVNVKRADSGALVAAVINAPLMAGDHLQTSPGSRAEVELDSANLVRLAPNTDLGFADLEYHRYQLQLAAGTIQYRVLRNQDAQIEIDTPSIAAKPLQTGEYRIAVLDDGTTQITVRSGELEIYSPRGSEQIGAGKTVLVRGDPSDPEFLTEAEIPRDQFDDWCANRDQTLLASRSYQYVSPDVNGAADLDAYGQWVPSQYGTVWAPQPPYAGWSPYSDGEWIWEPYYGWTWVDYAPWGWAPYHYGRWFWNAGYGWCWWPGPIGVHVYWAPALVGFFGWGGFGVGFGGGIGWVALAPYEVLHPWWGHGFYAGYYSRTWVSYNMWRNVDVMRIYRNAAIRGGAMIASYDRFGHPGERFSPATIGQLRQANLFRGAMPLAPTRASLQFSMRRAIENPRLASASQRTFYMHEQPRMLSRVPFSQQQMRLQQAFGRPQSSGIANAPRTNYPAPPARNGGWQRFGDPGAGNSYRQSFLRNGQNNSGWHQFGSPEHNPGGFSAIRPNAQPQQNYRPMQPSYRAMQPGYRSLQPNYRSVQPSYRTWQPSYRESQPSFRAFQPGYAAPRYNPPVAPRFNAPSFRAPSFSGGLERGFRPNSAPTAPSRGWGNFAPRGGGGGGGGGHSSPGGRRGR